MQDIDQLVLNYLETGGKIVRGRYYKPRPEEKTFRNDRGSTFNSGRKSVTLVRQGYKGKTAAAA